MSIIEWLVYNVVMFGAIIFFYRTFKFFYIRHKYNVCPKCGSKTIRNDIKEFTYADIETWEEISCTNLECDFKHKHTLFD